MKLDKYTYVYEADHIEYHHDPELACTPELQYPCSDVELRILKELDVICKLRQDLLKTIYDRGSLDEA
jgi:hypothetical protein